MAATGLALADLDPGIPQRHFEFFTERQAGFAPVGNRGRGASVGMSIVRAAVIMLMMIAHAKMIIPAA